MILRDAPFSPSHNVTDKREGSTRRDPVIDPTSTKADERVWIAKKKG
jgi:hypothetical protein